MVISTHLPPPVMIESAASLGVGHPHVVLKLRHVFLGRALLRERPRQHELGLEHRTGWFDHPVKRCRHPLDHGMLHPPLDVLDGVAGVSLVPVPIEVLGHGPELDDEVAGEVLRVDLPPLFPPKADQGIFVGAHDDAGVRASDEGAPIGESRRHGAAGLICSIMIVSLKS